jgi:hypothetical protein
MDHQLTVFLVGFSIGGGMARDFPARSRVIAGAKKTIAVRHWREGAIERNDFEIVLRQVELANDLRTKQANHIGAN